MNISDFNYPLLLFHLTVNLFSHTIVTLLYIRCLQLCNSMMLYAVGEIRINCFKTKIFLTLFNSLNIMYQFALCK